MVVPVLRGECTMLHASAVTGVSPSRAVQNHTLPLCSRSVPASCSFRVGLLVRARQTRLRAVRQSEDEGVDDSINAEFARIAERQRATANSARLELVWEVAKVSCVAPTSTGREKSCCVCFCCYQSSVLHSKQTV